MPLRFSLFALLLLGCNEGPDFSQFFIDGGDVAPGDPDAAQSGGSDASPTIDAASPDGPQQSATTPCPQGKAGLMEFSFAADYAFDWQEGFGATVSFNPSDELVVRFAIVPFAAPTLVAVENADVKRYPLNFESSQVNGAVTFAPGEWNTVEARYRFDTGDYLLTINGVEHPTPLVLGAGGDAATAFSVAASSDADGGGWIDSISIVKDVGGSELVLFEEDFQAKPVFSLPRGVLNDEDLPGGVALPAICQ